MEETTLKPVELPKDDPRREMPLFTRDDLARYIDTPPATVRNWIRGYEYPTERGTAKAQPIIISIPGQRGTPTIPFIGLAEALVLKAFREQGLSLQKIRAAMMALEKQVGIANVLANRALYVAGAEILWDYAKRAHDNEIRGLINPASGQLVFIEPVRRYLRLITYGSDMWPQLIELPAFRSRVIVDLHRGFGRPILEKYRIPIDEIVQRFYKSRDLISDIAADLEMEARDVEDVVQVIGPPRAA
jgi:uncharacterized protein (DUF433 family)